METLQHNHRLAVTGLFLVIATVLTMFATFVPA